MGVGVLQVEELGVEVRRMVKRRIQDREWRVWGVG